MPRDSNGNYYVPPDVNPVVPGTLITSDWANTTLDDVADAITDSISASGVTTPTADLPMGGRKHTGVGDPTAEDQYVALGMRRKGTDIRATITSGSNTLIATLQGLTAYTQYMVLSFVPLTNNSAGGVTLGVNGLPQLPVYDSAGEELSPDDLMSGTLAMVYNTGSAWRMITVPGTSASGTSAQKSITGWLEPTGGYTALTVDSATEVGIPAGTGVIVYADGSVDTVTWTAASVDITGYMSGSMRTWLFIAPDSTPFMVSGQPESSVYRENICLGYAIHVDGATITEVVTAPAILGGNNYTARDTTNVLAGKIVSGGAVYLDGNNATRLLNVAAAKVLMPGGDYTDENSVNLADMAGGSGISYTVISGWGASYTVVASGVTAAPYTQYFNLGTDTLVALGGPETVVHRLYWLGGSAYVWLIGAGKVEMSGGAIVDSAPYSTLDVAMNYIEYDRANLAPPTCLNGATLVAELVLSENAGTNWGDSQYMLILPAGKYNASLGASGGIGDAPVDGNTYGRKNAAWDQVTSASAPAFTGDLTVTKDDPQANLVMTTVGAGDFAQIGIKQGSFNWVTHYADYDSDEYRFRIHDPSDGSVLFTTTTDLATGETDFPAAISVAGVERGDVSGPVAAVTDGALALFDGTNGKLLKEGLVPGTVVEYDIQASATDTTPGLVMRNDGFGLGGTGGLLLPAGTTAQRLAEEGRLRRNTTTGDAEIYLGGSWVVLGASPVLEYPPNYLGGLGTANSSVNPTNAIDISPGGCTNDGTYGVPSSANTSSAVLTTTLGKLIITTWADGGTAAVPTGGLAPILGAPVNGLWYYGFLIWKDDGTVNFGWDTASDATNLLVAGGAPELAGYKHYRRICFNQYLASAIRKYWQDGDNFIFDVPSADATAVIPGATTESKTVSAPPLTTAILSIAADGATNAGTFYLKVRETRQTSAAASASNFDFRWSGMGTAWQNMASGRVYVRTSATRQVKISVSSATSACTYNINTCGWVDNRGR